MTSAEGGARPTLYLADKSAHQQRYRSADAAQRLDHEMEAGSLAVCEVVALELLYSARNASDYQRLQQALSVLPWCRTTWPAMRRAMEVQEALAQRGQHRRPLPDLMVAATAEEHGAIVLHYDHDFDLIAGSTGQPTEWIVPRGTAG